MKQAYIFEFEDRGKITVDAYSLKEAVESVKNSILKFKLKKISVAEAEKETDWSKFYSELPSGSHTGD
jgi:hypothetical protein